MYMYVPFISNPLGDLAIFSSAGLADLSNVCVVSCPRKLIYIYTHVRVLTEYQTQDVSIPNPTTGTRPNQYFMPSGLIPKYYCCEYSTGP